MAEEEKNEAEAPQEEAAAPEEKGPVLTAKEIDKMNVPKLKEAALAYGGKISGVHGMDKTQLIRALKEINDIPLIEAKRTSKIDRSAVKQQIKALKTMRDQSIETKDGIQLKRVRRRIKSLRRKLVRTA
ncbi:MAG: hypothetical protein J4F48_06540 [Nitrospinae bacterium]|nr:hypothetical protein [Nitrospinota bacterium]